MTKFDTKKIALKFSRKEALSQKRKLSFVCTNKFQQSHCKQQTQSHWIGQKQR